MQNPRSPWEANSSVVDLFTRHYAELRDVARRHLCNERRGHTRQSTALVHEAFLRLSTHRSAFSGRTHFIALAATTMRRLLVEHARARAAGKRRWLNPDRWSRSPRRPPRWTASSLPRG